MGGYGSGRNGWHGKIEDFLCLNVNQVQKRGFLVPGASCLWQWTCTTGDKSSIRLCAMLDTLRLEFRVRTSDAIEWRDMVQMVDLERTSCHFGGTRTWFRCPKCKRRVAKLYGGAAFYCRQCHNLAYRSQAETYADRCYRRANKLREKLGCEPGAYSFLIKPKWMRWPTFERISQEVEALEKAGLLAAMERFPTLLGIGW